MRCGAGMNLHLEPVDKVNDCWCQTDSVFSAQHPHWASSVVRPPSRTLRMTVAPWPMSNGPYTSERDVDLESLHTLSSDSSPYVLKTEQLLPKKIDIDSSKLLSSVCKKAERVQTVRNTSTDCVKRTLLRYTDAHIRKPEHFPTVISNGYLDHSYSRRLSSSFSHNYSNTRQGFPNMLNRFRLNSSIPKGTNSTLFLDDPTKNPNPKLTIYEPKLS